MSNRLKNATSPYLLQHADNPVDWWEWGEEALRAAREQQRPILLSIGYSACHWCHVMAHESFEDKATAALMNEHFINIKVDREERPDLDQIYQSAHQLLARRPGGWPLTVFLTPDDQLPFFAGTYFPPAPRHGLPAFRDLLRQIAAAWRAQPDAIREQNQALLDALNPPEAPTAHELPDDDRPLQQARAALAQQFDERHGGFGKAPKFPHPSYLSRLLRDAAGNAREMALRSLEAMADGGMNDQLGGGFFRYSTDERWEIPHFEKMLYDNGPLLALYAEAWRITGEPSFERGARRTAAWVMREMQTGQGGYASSLDADSEGIEGRFYTWTPKAVEALLDPSEYRIAAAHWGLDQAPNFEGRWHLRVARPLSEVARQAGLSPSDVERHLESAREKLFVARERRVRPARDDKVLTAWNGLMITGMARAGRILGDPRLLDSAEHALDHVHERLWNGQRLLATSKDDQARLNAYLDDHAFLLEGLLEYLQCRWRMKDLTLARALAEILLTHFEDREHGGFFFTSDDHEPLIQRPKPFDDNALPSGNGVAALALQRLGLLLGEPRYLEAAARCLRAASAMIARAPWACCALLDALDEQRRPGRLMVLRGRAQDCAPWLQRFDADARPGDLRFVIPADEPGLPPALAAKQAVEGAPVTAWLCEAGSCRPPVTRLEGLASPP